MNAAHTTPALQAFAFDSHAVRVVTKDGQPWFVAKDVAQCLNIQNHRQMVGRLDEDEKDGVYITDAIGREQKTTVVNESGMYAAVLRCDGAMTPGTPAHTFRKWVTSQVLPAIRQTGAYIEPGLDPAADRYAAMDARLDRVIGLLEKLIETLPALVAPRSRRPHRRMYKADLPLIASLREQGAALQDVVAQTGFSKTQVWAVFTGHIEVKPGGRVVIRPASPMAQQAELALKGVKA